MKKHLPLLSFLIGITVVFMVGMTVWNAVVIRDFYVFVHSRGNSDLKPGTGKTYDEINLQSGIDKAQQQGRELHTFGNEYFTTIGVAIDDYNQQLIWEGGGIYLTDIDGGTNALIRSKTTPPDMGDANVRVERHPVFRNMNLKGGSGNIGIDIGPSYGAVYENIRGKNLQWVIYTRFGLKSIIRNCFATNCTNGFAFGTLIGTTPGATFSNSQSNSSEAETNRVYMNTGTMAMLRESLGADFEEKMKAEFRQVDRGSRFMNSSSTYDQALGLMNNQANRSLSATGTAFLAENSSGIIYDNNIIEGGRVGIGYEINAPNNTVVKDVTIRNLHYESLVTDVAMIYVRWGAGIVTVDKIFSQYPAIVADIGSTPGYTQTTISNVSYCVLKNGKAFNNQSNTSWKFINCDNPLFGDQPLGLFNGIAVRSGCNTGGGPNQVCITPINR